jgi:MFS transporter, UMF1 family
MLITAAIFALASLPTFLFLKERAQPQTRRERVVAAAISRVKDTFEHARNYLDLTRFLICLVFYQAGIQAVVALAAIYAEQAMGFDTARTLLLILVVNVTASVGALAFGYVQDRLGHIPTIALTLIGWIIMVALAWAATTPPLFWIAANVAGISLGASQSAARALVGYLSPETRRGEFFGLWGLAVKLSSILGPITYGLVSWISGGNHRLAILMTGSYFVIGLALLYTVSAERGRRAALSRELVSSQT